MAGSTLGVGGLFQFYRYIWSWECFSPGVDLTKKELGPMMEEDKTAFQNVSKQDPVRALVTVKRRTGLAEQ